MTRAISMQFCAVLVQLERMVMSDLVEFRHLKYIAAIAETANFTRAAEQLYVAQPSLSRQIRELEDAIAVRMFLRNRDGVYITAAGRMIADYAQEAIRMRNEIVKIARAVHKGEVPILRMGFSCFVNPKILRSFSDTYTSLFPECPIQFSSADPSQILRGMDEKVLDGALLPLPVEGEQWVLERLASAPLVVCMRVDDPLAQRGEIAVSELAKRLKIFRNPDTHPAAHKRLMEMLSEHGIYPEISNLAATPADIQWLVKSGFGLALIDKQTVLDAGLTTRPIAGMHWTVDTAFVHRDNAEHLALPILTRHLRKMRSDKPRKRVVRSIVSKPVQLELLP